MGACVSAANSKPHLRLGDRLYERRSKCVEEFGLRMVASINDQLKKKTTRKHIKEAYHYGIYKLNEANATPTTKLFLEKSAIKHMQELEEEVPPEYPTTTTTTTPTIINAQISTLTTPAVTKPKPRRIALVQYADLEDIVTKPILQEHGLGVHLESIPNSYRYNIWLSWYNAPPMISKLPSDGQNFKIEEQPRFKLPFDGMLPSTIQIGQLEGSPEGSSSSDSLPPNGSLRY
jgi:hypothetical protein